MLLNEDGAFIEYWLALALPTIPENWGNLDPISKFVQVRKALAAVTLKIFSMGNIVGCVHIIPKRATISMTGVRRNERWIVNSHTGLVTWNDKYMYETEDSILRPGRKNGRRGFRSDTYRSAIPMQAHAK
jgi:hypothetical protein